MANVFFTVRGQCFVKPFKRIDKANHAVAVLRIHAEVKARVREPLGHNLQVRMREVTNA